MDILMSKVIMAVPAPDQTARYASFNGIDKKSHQKVVAVTATKVSQYMLYSMFFSGRK